MTEREKEYLKRITFVFPKLDNGDKRHLLGIAEGMALNKQFQKEISAENDKEKQSLQVT